MSSTVEDGVREAVGRYFHVPPAEVDLDLPVEEAADSLELSGLVVAVEKRFGITLPDSAVGRLRVVRDLIPMVEERLGPAARR